MIRCIFMDLDDTLYDSRLFFDTAFKRISLFLNEQYNLRINETQKKLWMLLYEKGSSYKRLFDDLLDMYKINNKDLVRKLVKMFHDTPVDNLELYTDAKEFLESMRDKFTMGIITKGSKKKQIKKIIKLGLVEYMDYIIYAEDLGLKKEDHELYLYALKEAKVKPYESVYVANNPYEDFIGPHKIGMKTVRIKRGEFAKIKFAKNDAKILVNNFYELKKLLISDKL